MIEMSVLESLCDDRGMREWISKPFSVQLGEQWWDCATNGHAVAAVRVNDPGAVRENYPPVSGLFDAAMKKVTHRARFKLLAKWLDNCEKVEACVACKGTGSHECACWYCDIEAGSRCPECEGDKGFPQRLEVKLGTVSFDRVLAAKYLVPFAQFADDANVSIGSELEPMAFWGDDWRVLIMPMRADGEGSTGDVPGGLIVPC